MTTHPILGSAILDSPDGDALILPCWAIVEALGHNRHGGYLSEATVLGTTFARLDIPALDLDGPGEPSLDTQAVTLLYHPNSLYRIVPVNEAAARAVAKSERFQPLSHWEIPASVRDDDEPPL